MRRCNLCYSFEKGTDDPGVSLRAERRRLIFGRRLLRRLRLLLRNKILPLLLPRWIPAGAGMTVRCVSPAVLNAQRFWGTRNDKSAAQWISIMANGQLCTVGV
ncbi:MAG: hypothetical protein AB7P18_27600 [Candidatus Binatia bacterium]